METPGNMVRETLARIEETVPKNRESELDRGWAAAMLYTRHELENLTSKIEGWELNNGH